MKTIIEKISEFEKKGISDIQMIALVSDTSSEVIFYGVVDGVRYQSNNMVEEGKVDFGVVDEFYDGIVKLIRTNEGFDAEKMNIVRADSDRCKFDYEEKKCKTFRIIRKWEENLPRFTARQNIP